MSGGTARGEGPVVGLLGCGRIGALYAAHLAALGPHRLVCVDVVPERAEALARKAPRGSVADSVEVLVSRGCDAALVTAATTSHPELVAELVGAGVPTLCEKPLAVDPATTEALGRAAERRGVPLWVGFQRRFDPGFAGLRARAAAGDLGRAHVLRLVSHDMAPPPLARLRESGSVFTDLMLHDFDLVRWLTGRTIVRVTADGAALACPELADLGDFDTVTAMLRLDDGTLAVLTAGRRQPLGYDVRAELLGEQGNLEATPTGAAEPGAGGAPAPRHQGYWDRFATAYRTQLRAFLTTAAGGPPAPAAAGWRDSHAALRCALAAERSVAGGSVPVAL
ncbi:Gfo/Idh/MocA family oxidoreductase [Streptomyces mobaraensis NBRC 13819 = DSM 40847]|uniref:Oxidoreductase domain-containing protein n=1 Tax=Streptomyces mobaraensis (strain ATCC 29032 / DSM 40847 / JCM 4168 / NBRC 13819 / NCIMB 11159 / IPCR 16-22) TaxID=1223523 RepID=M3C1D3_STRM1|nr:Gfo/Idh/MocA family oxidoreductase [Streptomyces mobaraensis]EME97805.1 oxidoreductase domain-containing protein [Streptomyces mobaraensis NBRC 13819 = DSM 40847]QTT72438.1 Gfo/Idh/MocA family oxidoreductase [Streptomyces mobaraensis NBRC 13819 = DSM 40847]